MKKMVKSLTDLESLADDFLKKLKKGKRATLVTLTGDLGSGKTAFTQRVGKILGIKAKITSPTFVIQKKYELSPSEPKEISTSYKQLIHIDAYRLNNGRDLLVLDWDEIMNNPDNLILLEWPERVKDIVPTSAKKISFKFIDDSSREIVF
ncbi:MAG TPA: tRNA (adenosine(37)-N6)-threonylcarbamoyltransferase complex ATPase subunit type 1 TsaE [Candidatus Paceibacterota bacterium]|nr:tRNA (adenosine(37)-N6)-threonylcarbamoyltransferase complex ATPase subunit type 1 TsaE [Candidatus Paceibacterota bacterium]